MDASMLKISFQKISQENLKEVKEGTTLKELSKDFQKYFKGQIVAARVNNEIKELNHHLTDSCNVEFIDISMSDGQRIYIRGLTFVLIKAVKELYPERSVVINHSISKGLYIEIKGATHLTPQEVSLIQQRMQEIIQADKVIDRKTVPLEEAREIFQKTGRLDRDDALEFRSKPYVTLYILDDMEDYFFGYMVPSTGYLRIFELKFYAQGLILCYPLPENPSMLPPFEEQKKLFNVFLEQKKWLRILGVSSVTDLNRIIKAGKVGDFIRVAEGLHEKKIAQIADKITDSEHKKRAVLIAGPSSSGKTTFVQRLAIQLRVNGVRPVTLSLDDYFLNREDTPKDDEGNYDFENLDAIDVNLFNRHLAALIQGEEVEIPLFNFTVGRREKTGRKMKINSDQVLIIEGIHGLNERLTSLVSKEAKYKIYISALTTLNIDEHNRITTTDTRLIRRMVRDFQFRGSSASNTIRIWPSVRRGEERNIFPFQEEADVMFNSALNYELFALRIKAEALLSDVHRSDPGYAEAKRILEFIRNFLPIESHDIPANSIAQEFLGGSCFF